MQRNKIILGVVSVLLILVLGVIVLASLSNSDRYRDQLDQRAKAAMSSLSVQSEMYEKSHNDFSRLCEDIGSADEFKGIYFSPGTLECNDSKTEWATGIILPQQGVYYCLDSKGAQYTTARGLKEGETECPPAQQ